MNTPKPCDTCKHLYWDVLREEDPTDSGECKRGLWMGNLKCPEYSLHPMAAVLKKKSESKK